MGDYYFIKKNNSNKRTCSNHERKVKNIYLWKNASILKKLAFSETSFDIKKKFKQKKMNTEEYSVNIWENLEIKFNTKDPTLEFYRIVTRWPYINSRVKEYKSHNNQFILMYIKEFLFTLLDEFYIEISPIYIDYSFYKRINFIIYICFQGENFINKILLNPNMAINVLDRNIDPYIFLSLID